MALQIANPRVVQKVETLAQERGLSKTGAVEQAIDRMLKDTPATERTPDRIRAILRQLDALPDVTDRADPLSWDEHGLPA
jgi:antitoxin VapB